MKKLLLIAGAVVISLGGLLGTFTFTQVATDNSHLLTAADPGDMGS